MPQISVRIPINSGNENFASLARKRAGLSTIRSGLGAIPGSASTRLPGSNLFTRFAKRGMGVIAGAARTILPGADLFSAARPVSVRRSGMGQLTLTLAKPPVFPGKNIFVKFEPTAKSRGMGCVNCAATRGLGQDDDDDDGGLDVSDSGVTASGTGFSVNYGTPDFETSDSAASIGDITSSPVTFTTPTGGTLYLGDTGPTNTTPDTNPSLSAFNTALAQQMATPGTVASSLTPNQLGTLSNAIGAATVSGAQLAQVLSQTGQSATAGQQLSGFLSQNAGLLLLGGVGFVAIMLISSSGGKKR